MEKRIEQMTLTTLNLPSFGSLLKSFRTRNHLTQQQLARAIGVHRHAIGRWERGDFLPTSKAIVLEVARHLRLDEQETRHLLEASLTAFSPHWSVPYPRNPFFTGREEILETLHTQLGVDQAVALTQSSALHGLGGVGKTQTALEYAYRYVLEYRAVFWIGAESREQVISSLVHIASILHLPERDDTDQQKVATAVQRWLSTHNQWLLIWDNVEDLTLLEHFLPPGRSEANLITTRRQALGTLVRGLDLPPLAREEGILFLLRRAKVLTPEAARDQIQRLTASMPAEYTAAGDLVTVLGGLPLALDQVGAYIEETACSLTGYVQRYTQQRTSLLNCRGNSSGAGHPQSVTTTFRLAYERIEREQPIALHLLHACAFLHPEAIPEGLFVEGTAHLGPELARLVGHPLHFDQAIATLRSLSLIRCHPETRTLSMHRLVQEVLKDSLEAPLARQWSERVIRTLNAVFPEPEFVHWPRCEQYILHATASLRDPLQAGSSVPEARLLFLKAGSYLVERGCYLEAEKFLTQAYELGEQLQIDHDLVTANTLDRLATLYWRQARYQVAEQLFQRALAIGERCLGSDHPETSIYLNDLALLYYEQGKYQQAEMFQQRALTAAQRRPASELALSSDNMARILEAQGKIIQAEQLFQRALRIWENLPGPLDPSMTFCHNNIGMLNVKQRKYDLAEPLLSRALTMRQQSLGLDHPRTATSLHNLARLFREQGKYEEAIQISQWALHIFEQRAGVDRWSLVRVLTNLGVLYQILDQDEQAVSFFTRALVIQEQDLGQDHPETANILHHLAILRQKQGNLNEALSLAGRALNIRSQAQGVTHPDTLTTQTLYVQLLGAHERETSQSHAEESPDPHRTEQLSDGIVVPLHEAGDRSPTENDPLEEFLTACCELHPRAWCRSADLWQTYQQWTEEHDERYPFSRRAFIIQLKVHGCRADRTTAARIWRGIALLKKER